MPVAVREIDFVAYDDRGQVILLGEAKGRRGVSDQWAARFRRNMLAHGTLPKAAFFFIATPEHLYFWRQDRPLSGDEPPEFTIDATKELKPYFEKSGQAPGTVSEQGLEVVVWWWLTDIAISGRTRAKHDPSIGWLADSGLIDALEKARIEMNPAQ
jgi:hypothetical protein